MRKIETIWHHILYSALEKKVFKHTQKDLAQEFGYSLSTVNHALNTPTKLGAVRKTAKFFTLEDFEKLLYYWASVRNLEKDIIYKTYVAAPISEIEGMVPPETIFACYSAAKIILKEAPADYSGVYFYADPNLLPRIRERFPADAKNQPNVFVLKMTEAETKYGGVTTLPQTFVDIWNLRDWYAKEFTQALGDKIHGILS